MNLIKFYLWKDRSGQSFDVFVDENNKNLFIESIVLFTLCIILLIVMQFSVIFFLPLALSALNIYVVLSSGKKSKNRLIKRSFKYQIRNEFNILLYKIRMLGKLMHEKKSTKEEIDKWYKYYINRVKEYKNINNVKSIIESIESHFTRISAIPMPELKEKDFDKFVKETSEKMYKKYYPEFLRDIDDGKFSNKKSNTSPTSNGDSSSRVSGSNTILEAYLRSLGLSTGMRDLEKIKARYYEMVSVYHPDRAKDMSREECQLKMSEINTAYQEIKKILNSSPKL